MSENSHTSTVDRYLETIFYIAAEGDVVRPGRLSTWLGVSAPTVSEALRRLERDGWITLNDDRSVDLTADGDRVASAVVRRHRVLERWLTDVLGFDWAEADLEAERMASAISDEVIDRMDQSMGTPSTCPHGNTIPGRVAVHRELVAVNTLEVGDVALVRRISEVAEHEGQLLLRLLAKYGVGEGAPLELLSSAADGSCVVAVGQQRVDLPGAAASAIWVEHQGVST
jgi:DtxR family Mn-dependent transcriptional regulator